MASGTEFLIEIEQRMKGDSAVTELSKLGDSFTSAKSRYLEFQKANETAARALDKVGAQIAATKAKVDAATKIGDTAGATKAGAALEALTKKQDALRLASDKAKAGIDAETKSLTAIAGKVAQANKGVDSGTLAQAGKGLSKFGGPLGELGGKVSKLARGWGSLEGVLGTTGAVGAVAAAGVLLVAAAVVAVTAAVAIGAAKVLAWAVGLADSRRELALTAKALEVLSPGLTGLADTFAGVSSSTGIESDRLTAITRSLQQAGVAGKDIPNALRAIATQEAAIGDSSGTQALIDSLKSGQTSANGLATTIDQKFGGIVRQRMLGLGAQSATLERNLGRVFGGLKVDGLLEGLAKLGALLDVNTASGAALKVLFETIFQPLLGSDVTDVFTSIERAILHVEIAALSAAVGIKKLAAGTDWSGLEALAKIAGSVVWTMFVGAITLGAAALVAFAKSLSVAVNIGTAAGNAFRDIGTDIVDGLIAGILAGSDKAIKAITGVTSGIVDAARHVLDSHSPSRVFAEIGLSAPQGMVQGIERGEDGVASAMARVASPPTESAATGRGGGSAVTITGNTWIFQGVKDAETAQHSFVEELLGILEGVGIQVATEAR